MKNKSSLNYYQKLYLKYLQKRKKWKQEQKFPGENKCPDKIFYIVRRSGMKLGLFSLMNVNLAKIDYACKKGMIPVVDMQNFRNCFHDKSTIGLENIWEDFFEQPFEYSLSQAYRAKKIIISDAGVPEIAPNDTMDFLQNKDRILDYWRQSCEKYIKIKPAIKEKIDNKINNLINGENRVLGVLARGTDYVKLQPSNHPIQPSVEMLINKSKVVMHEYNCNKLFLATEDKKIADAFKSTFGDKCITNQKDYVKYEDGYLSDIKYNNENKIENGIDYLSSILILSKCNCIVAGRTSGTVGACLFSKGWEYSYFFDLGYYK